MKILHDILEPAAASRKEAPGGRRLGILALSALGVVFGDIGTSPLYAVKECFHGRYGVVTSRPDVLGVISLVFWSLIVVISVKYLLYVMRADNRGEGGILALMALVYPSDEAGARRRWLLVAMGLFGAALLYGDGTITPAISVLSAMEGLQVVTPSMDPWVLPLTIVILIALFAFQRRGTGGVGAVFGPVMVVWFAVIGLLGARGILLHPSILAAVSPLYALEFFGRHGLHGFLVLAAVFLVVTGGEALYADMGHFGKRPIRTAWFALVLPCLLLNYFGQGALLLVRGAAVKNPFFQLAPDWALVPLVLLATGATVIASQAVISGAFSLTRQAIQLGYSPHLRTEHTSPEEIGQIYIPSVNWILMLATIGLVLGFRRSSNLAAAYGVAVTTTMVITTLLAFVVARELWSWGRLPALGVSLLFLVPDLAFFGANMTKITQGGWFPLLVAVLIYTLMSTWSRGRALVGERLREREVPIETFLEELGENPPPRIEGTAVFLTGLVRGTPTALVQHVKHNRVLHQRVVLLTVVTRNVPFVPPSDRITIKDIGDGFYRVFATYGFMQDPSVPDILRLCGPEGLEVDIEETSFYVGREILIPSRWRGMALWREKLFAMMSRNSQPSTAFFHVPHRRVIELGVEVEL